MNARQTALAIVVEWVNRMEAVTRAMTRRERTAAIRAARNRAIANR